MNKQTFRYAGHASYVVYRLIDLIILTAVFIAGVKLYDVTLTSKYGLLLCAHMLCYSYLAESVQLYRSWRVGRFSRMLALLVFVHTLSFLLVLAALFVFKQSEAFSRAVLVGWYLGSICTLVLWRCCAKMVKTVQRRRGLAMQKVAIIGAGASGMSLYQEISRHPELGFDCIGFFDDRAASRLPEELQPYLRGNFSDVLALARNGDLVKLYISLPMLAEQRVATMITELGDTTVDVLLVPDFLMKNLMHGRIGNVGEVDTISVFESPGFGIQNFYKRSFDIAFSLCALLTVLPLMLLIALAVKLTSNGPVLFKQDRYGLDGRRIGVYKFRSMRAMDNGQKVVQATRNDSRITPVGAFLRRTSLDELPQFFNVLTGDMSVVGPRPHAVAHNEEYRKQVAFYMLRHKMRPGITGWAQINGWRGETDTLEKMEMRVKFDLDYIRNWSLLFDIKIILNTLVKGFFSKNAY
ncbi:capsular biosynthesis protein [Arsukibacterium ikkense]|uniref:Capsular biosynthesis protein n=1 Tax=Arsukibacterium ikkense TaxID=336831 RepID=A0A0M2V8W5_9GAMM|nr:undecaprenyl-phosphate glucose phosphotransferase [Arsukibacterium ikkense]KKO47056.1 capsular biosynthesis protein [Arsukibacterium ikkense]